MYHHVYKMTGWHQISFVNCELVKKCLYTTKQPRKRRLPVATCSYLVLEKGIPPCAHLQD